jgi:hypothetical protein
MHDPDIFQKAVKLANRYDSLWGSVNLFSNTRRTPSGTLATSTKPPPTPNSFLSRSVNLGGSHPTPIEIDALQRKPTPLTQTERAHLIKIGACFYCRQTGHMIGDCPNKSPGRPPMQRKVANMEQTPTPGAQPDLIDLGDKPREPKISMPQ